jgi:probable HAF family extracellular repeat protein
MARANQPVLVVLTSLLFTSLAAAQTYSVTDLGLLSGDTTSEGRALSPAGQVVGDNEYNLQGFVWDSTQGMLGLPRLKGGRYSVAMGINATGLIAGYATYNNIESTHAVLWTYSGIQDLGTLPGGTQSWAAAINVSAQVVGGSNSATTEPNAFLWSKDRGMENLGVLPNGYYSEAFGINNLGQVVGMSNTTRGNWHAFSWSKSAGMKDLGTLDSGRNTSATAKCRQRPRPDRRNLNLRSLMRARRVMDHQWHARLGSIVRFLRQRGEQHQQQGSSRGRERTRLPLEPDGGNAGSEQPDRRELRLDAALRLCD